MIKSLFRRLGIDVRLLKNVEKYAAVTWEQKQYDFWRPFLAHLDIRTVIDVGANTGQFAQLINRQCPDAKIISFEPLDSCQEELLSVLERIQGSRVVKKAVGGRAGMSEINESAFSPCSSLLSGTENLGEDFQDATSIKQQAIEIVTLDGELHAEVLPKEILLKLDVQGFEIPVIKGASKLLSITRIVVCEVCFFRKLYKGQPLFHEIYSELRGQGFTYMGNVEQSRRKADGRVVEADAIFERLVD